jgi:hypothetical protein
MFIVLDHSAVVDATLGSKKMSLVRTAIAKHGRITGLRGKAEITEECFTRMDQKVILFWYNDMSGSTHIVKETIDA